MTMMYIILLSIAYFSGIVATFTVIFTIDEVANPVPAIVTYSLVWPFYWPLLGLFIMYGMAQRLIREKNES